MKYLMVVIITDTFVSGTYMFIVEDDPAASKGSSKSTKAYGGSKTSRFDYPDLSSHTSGAGGGSYGATSLYTKPPSSSKHTESNKYEAPSYSVYSAATPKHATSDRGSNKSRFTKKKYGGAKTSYGDIGGVSYQPPSTSQYDMYKKHDTNTKYPPPKYDYTAKSKYGGASTGFVSGASSSRYGAGSYNPSSHDSNKYGSGSSSYSSRPNPSSSSSAYYQPVTGRAYNAASYRAEPQFADVKPSIVDTRPASGADNYQSKANMSLRRKEDTPEHNVSASIEQKASKYGGKYEAADGKIYYGGKPNKYSSKKSKKYNQRRKTMHGEVPQEKSDRPSV